MTTKFRNTKATTEKTEIVKSPYWLNVETPLGRVGINLANGIEQHTPFINICEEYGTEATTKWLQSKGFSGYLTQEGITKQFDAKVLANEMAQFIN